MRDANPGTIYLKDYQAPNYLINRTELHFVLGEEETLVTSRLHLLRNTENGDSSELILDGQDLELVEIYLDGDVLDPSCYEVGEATLLLRDLPEQCLLSCVTRIRPQLNTSLEGLYRSQTMFCTQCEAEGFRKITYYLDRPDVMSVFTVTIDADADRYPVLLSNGNLEETSLLANGLTRVLWHDPFPKPSYLFALVAGDLEHIEDSFTTCSGREVALRIYVEEKDIDKCDHAMDSLKRSMRWDEEVFGREYDLDIFNVVAVDDFNMGAMENKSLNIFNTSCVLCDPNTTTDVGYQRVEAIVAHEYFHNWSGNRVTCRDWFQLSLKEGFTVFRDAEFSSDMGSRTVKRVEDVTLLRSAQFAEDAGPMAHPVRPESYIEINNFYTLTVYEKGAEVVRMIHTLLGPQAFRAGSDLYFARHDGQAVTCEDFVLAMEEASGADLGQFRNWYSQAGTPRLTVTDAWNKEAGSYALTISQSCPATPGQDDKKPFVIPVAMGLLGDAGNLRLQLQGEAPDPDTEDNTHMVLMVDKPEQTFVFEGLPEKPVPSLLRGFSAPVRLEFDYSRNDLCRLMSGDDDGFVRWDSAQSLGVSVITEVQAQLLAGDEAQVDPLFLEACGALLQDDALDPAMLAEMLSLPSENYLAELAGEGAADVQGIYRARTAVLAAVGSHCREALEQRYAQLAVEAKYAATGEQIAARSLRAVCLNYLAAAGASGLALANAQFAAADNITERLAALRVLSQFGSRSDWEAPMAKFYDDWGHETLAVNQWLAVQASMPDDGAIARVRHLMEHPDFDLRNPNKVRSLVGTFAGQNPLNFHREDGSGYRLLRQVVAELNSINPQIASRLLAPLTKWRYYQGRAEQMRSELELLASMDGLSADVFEVVSKSLK
ncbi:aminopeptidase N [Halioglobus japonicus]|uniref:Aminopeptidase N n=1 Tax=Halioglobus japonicus TaxID=930805 RepID=A0AAP8MEX7_9GAMM|nr:aminopeptidase N [Halioglobus japonicus]AQA18548.1 aminopeptidase N [Halioglobus japonicus]PLW86571.1 aminopeptidase N [Halioglobus japonicus]GHD12193.1 aminopeptidase N [Halioglobus japonicus]